MAERRKISHRAPPRKKIVQEISLIAFAGQSKTGYGAALQPYEKMAQLGIEIHKTRQVWANLSGLVGCDPVWLK
jgi:hypothetical protein